MDNFKEVIERIFGAFLSKHDFFFVREASEPEFKYAVVYSNEDCLLCVYFVPRSNDINCQFAKLKGGENDALDGANWQYYSFLMGILDEWSDDQITERANKFLLGSFEDCLRLMCKEIDEYYDIIVANISK